MNTVAAFCLCWACVPPAPPDVELNDLLRFPPRDVAYQCWQQARQHEEWISCRAALYPDLCLDPWVGDARWCRIVWGLLDDAHLLWGQPQHRLELLRCLREQIGDEAYFAGRMPPHLPVWRFGRMD